MGRQLDRLMPFWQPAIILHSVLIFMLLWQINVVDLVKYSRVIDSINCSSYYYYYTRILKKFRYWYGRPMVW